VRSFGSNSYRFLARLAASAKLPRFVLYSASFVAICVSYRNIFPGIGRRTFQGGAIEPAAAHSSDPQRPPPKSLKHGHWDQVFHMKIRVGFEMIYDFPQATPLIAVVGTHFTRASDILVPDYLTVSPSVPITPYRDGFGNWCSRIVAPAGRVYLAADGLVRDSGLPDVIVPAAIQHAVEELPAEAIVYLLGSRYCETDRLSDLAWKLFEKTTPGWARVQAICDFVHNHIAFGYEHARATMTAWEVFNEGKGVCRDYAHLAIAFCRCMNIPARYCTGYLGDIGMPPPYAAGDFAGWFEAYIGGRWYTFDARNNVPRIGRVLIAQGRDAADVPITQTFGPNTLVSFKVWTDEVVEEPD
jgi:transglutaminase-like putative cysteine protease